MEFIITIISFVLFIVLVIFPLYLIKKLNKLNLKYNFIVYLISVIIITPILTLILGWWTHFSNKIVLSHYGYNFDSMNGIERFKNVAVENVDRVKKLEINRLVSKSNYVLFSL